VLPRAAPLRWVRLLAAVIVVVLLVAVAVLVVEEPRVPSQASPPAPVPTGAAALPATVAAPTAAPARPVTTSPHRPGDVVPATRLSTGWGIDVSWPQCGPLGMPSVQPGFVVVGVNDGRPFTDNPCLAQQLAYARTRTGVAAYLNIDAPRSGDAAGYGRRVALDGLARMARAHVAVPVVWLDVEVMNHWSTSAAANVAVIAGAIQAVQSRGLVAGVYSSGPMWQQITGGAALTTPVWLATAVTDYRQLPQWCDQGLGGRAAEMAQYVAYDGRRLVDVDVLCPKAIPRVVGEFAAGAK
jgi:hypothetical protein